MASKLQLENQLEQLQSEYEKAREEVREVEESGSARQITAAVRKKSALGSEIIRLKSQIKSLEAPSRADKRKTKQLRAWKSVGEE